MASKIIDVSTHNGVINWDKVKMDGVTQAIIRLSMGYNTRDKSAVMNAGGARAAGINVGYYHFAYPDKRPGNVALDAKQEADYFTGLFGTGKMPPPSWLVVDLEAWDASRDTPLTKTEYLDWTTIFLSEVYAATNIVCMIYGTKFYLDAHLPANHKLGTFPLWVANYNKVKRPALPIGWSEYFLWQYTEKGTVNGITTNCDLSVLYHSIVLDSLATKVMQRMK